MQNCKMVDEEENEKSRKTKELCMLRVLSAMQINQIIDKMKERRTKTTR